MKSILYSLQIATCLILSACKDGSTSSNSQSSKSDSQSLVGNAYVNEDNTVLYIIDDKYAKNNYAIKEDKVELIEYRIDGNKFIYDDSLGKVILEISDDQSRIFGTCGVLELDMKQTNPAKLTKELRLLFNIAPE